MTIQRTIPWPQACDFIGQAARGLHYAHEAGFVHRDIKPDNLLILEDGTVKLLDFGLALVTKKANMPEFQQSDESKNLGTADYVAPEQIRNAMTVDGRADIYSLGGTFYFALTGGPPFPTESKKETIESQLKRDPRPLRELAPDVPDEVAAIVQRMMAKSRSARFATAAEVAEALEPFAERKPVEFDFANVLRARAKSARLRALAAADSQETSQDSIVRAVASSIHLPNSAEIATPLPVPTEVDLVTASERLHADDAKALTERPQAVQGEMPAQGETEQLGALSEVIRDSQTTTTDEHHRLQTEMAELQQQIYALRQDLQHRNEALAQLQAALDEERQRRMAEQQRRAEIEQTLQETLARQQTRAREVQGLSREVQIVQKDVLSKYEPVSSLLHIVEQNSVGMEHESQKKVLVDMFRDEDLLAAVANHSSDSPQDADSAPP
jgi:serine/threonine protein kinase